MKTLCLGIDIGSTTVKAVLIDEQEQCLYSVYRRHNARQTDTLVDILGEMNRSFPQALVQVAVCGSGGRPLSEGVGLPFVQEVVANATAVSHLYRDVRTAVELGGQDAKVVFFAPTNAGTPSATDMRMNGSCAGGTGAFIDEIAALLQCPIEEFNALASKGTQVYDISGRCGVFAKTDIQPLLLQGAKREDIALSAFHAIAKQTIGGLSQGLELRSPIIFEGGPLTFNPRLTEVFAERLQLKPNDIVLPEHPETIVSYGAALAIESLFPNSRIWTIGELLQAVEQYRQQPCREADEQPPLFASEEEKKAFTLRHDAQVGTDSMAEIPEDKTLSVYVGIDSGSTTSKLVAIDEQCRVVYRFYQNNHGKPLDVLRNGLLGMRDAFAVRGITLVVKALGTTGYGEQMTAAAFGADYHTVETIAHAQGGLHYIPDASFILDIGGQDMKAIWLRNGVITNIVLNEACSSGCGSFLENFADTLGIAVEDIADCAFRSASPANLGSRCTVFMTSTIINEQRRGKNADDLLAGLCRSIVENVFTKVIRLNNKSSMGTHIVVQGGTFRNRAVLRAFEEYMGQEVTLAPYAGEMGAIGIALLAKSHYEEQTSPSRFIGFKALEDFAYTTETGLHCGKCENNCALTVTRFTSLGTAFTMGNRCERGAEKSGHAAPAASADGKPTDLFALRNRLLFRMYDVEPVREAQQEVIGIPRVLEFWNSMPFWTTLFRALGYEVRLSHPSDRRHYEEGLPFVASDTICFPAKLVHGHIIDLAEQLNGYVPSDRDSTATKPVSKSANSIFFPYIMHLPPEGRDKLSPYVCSVVQGYPMVTRHSQQPEQRYGVRMLTPIFHFFSEKDCPAQVRRFAMEQLHCTAEQAEAAYRQAEAAMHRFRRNMREAGGRLLAELRGRKQYGVVLAGRPYQCDPMVNHRLPTYFTSRGLSVFTVDSLPTLDEQDLRHTRVEITNNFHTRMLAAVRIAAETPELEYAQIVSFGCGHDAILSDEIVRIMETISHKSPLILKVDESDAGGALSIRVQSFVESVAIRRAAATAPHLACKTIGTIPTNSADRLPTAFPAQYTPADKQLRTLLVPNISAEVSTLLCAVFRKHGFKVKGVPVGGVKQIKIGKQYSHNDICFPCQMVIGELIDAIRTGGYRQEDVAVGMVKFQCDCRLSHYSALLRKALDAAGYERVPIVTTDPNDTKQNQPGVQLLSLKAVVEAVSVFMMLDIIQDLVRKIRPYELRQGITDHLFRRIACDLAEGIEQGLRAARKTFERGIEDLAALPYDRTHLKPRVFVTGELLVTYHPGSNFHIEEYLERNGMETIFPRVTDQLRKDFLASMAEIRDFKADIPKFPFAVTRLFDLVQHRLERIAVRHPLYRCAPKPADLYQEVKHIIPETLSCGEGWLMAAEIAHYAKEGVRSAVILQPFGCLPNHICGRGTIRALKNDFPDMQILPLDLDPDTSYANVENRLQMLIMNNR